jgi:hypothetical protein
MVVSITRRQTKQRPFGIRVRAGKSGIPLREEREWLWLTTVHTKGLNVLLKSITLGYTTLNSTRLGLRQKKDSEFGANLKDSGREIQIFLLVCNFLAYRTNYVFSSGLYKPRNIG